MNKTTKLVSLVLAVLMLAVLVAGCGGGGTSASPSATGSAGAPSASQPDTSSGSGGTRTKLVMGTNAEFPPFESVEGNGYVGIDVEICEAIAKKLGLEFEVNDMEFDALLSALNAGKCDVVAAGMTVNPDREKEVDFTEEYYGSTQVVIVKKDDNSITDQDSLVNKKIGVQVATTGNDVAQEVQGATVSEYTNGSLAVMDLINGKIDCVIIDEEPAKRFVAANEADTKIVNVGFPDEYYAIAVKKGDAAFLKEVNDALKALKADGTVEQIIEKYMLAD